jgi:hypothetical protein
VEVEMAYRMIDKQWHLVFEKLTSLARKQALLISPFIQKDTLHDLLGDKPKIVRVITRFNCNDFQSGVSDIKALEYLLQVGAQVRGIQNLHAKVFIFNSSRAIIGSANLTNAALFRNSEFGIESDDAEFVQATSVYFNQLWDVAESDLNTALLTKMKHEIIKNLSNRSSVIGRSNLSDYGKNIGYEESPDVYPTGRKASNIDVTSFLAFCKTIQGRELTTIGGRARFHAEMINHNLRYRPVSSGRSRSYHTALEDVLDRYNKIHSLQPKDYHDITWNASYTLAIIKLYFNIP